MESKRVFFVAQFSSRGFVAEKTIEGRVGWNRASSGQASTAMVSTSDSIEEAHCK